MNPRVVIIAGPNGSGKSTSAPALVNDYLGIKNYVNADTIAAGLSAFNAESMAIEAGRIMLRQLEVLVSHEEDFAFETTLASRSFARSVSHWKTKGYVVALFFMWLPSAELAKARVKLRVQSGGHDIPESVIQRRYQRGLQNLTQLYIPIVDYWRIYDNSSASPEIIAIGSGSNTTVFNEMIWNQIREYQT